MYSLDSITHVKAAATFTGGVSPCLLSKWRHFDPGGVIQVGLVLCQENVPEKVPPIKIAQTQIAQWKWSISWGSGDWQPHHITIPLVDIHLITYIYFIQYIYLFIMQKKYTSFTSTFLGMIHSNRTVVLLLHKHFGCWLSTSCNPISIITNCTYVDISNLTLWYM